MSFTSAQKGKARAAPAPSHPASSSGSSSSSDADSDSDSDSSASGSESEAEDPNTYLALALSSARARAAAKSSDAPIADDEDEMIALGDPASSLPRLPPLDPGALPESYLAPTSTARRHARDAGVQHTLKAADVLAGAPAPPVPAKPVDARGRPLTKREMKDARKQTAGKDWFDLPAPRAADVPALYREVEALRMRNALDPKRFYKKDEGESKGIKGLPKHFAIGRIVETPNPFGNASSADLTKAQRKRTLVDELVDDADAARYAKRKFLALQGTRARNGKGTLHERNKKRKPKW